MEQLLKQLLERASFSAACIMQEIRKALDLKLISPVEARAIEIAVRELLFATLQNNWSSQTASPKETPTEQEILKLCAAVIGVDCPDGMRQNGAIWRSYIRGNGDHAPHPDKVVHVMNALQNHIAEGRPIKTTPGRCALDFYKRFAG